MKVCSLGVLVFLGIPMCGKFIAFKIGHIRDVAVIGGGVGGLISSTLLSRSGLDVLLIEKNPNCGGRMNTEFISHPTATNVTYRFDVGPSLLLLPDVYKETFDLIGSSIDKHVELLKVEPFYRCYFEEDRTFAEISSCEEKMRSVTNRLEPNSYGKFVDYLKTAGDFLRFGLPTVIQEKPDFTHFGSFVMACIKIFPLRSHDSMLQQFFKSPKLRAMMSFQDLYIGLSPYESPAIFSLLQALELERGIFYPKGGFRSVANALESIAMEAGVEIIHNCELESIQLASEDTWRDSVKGDAVERTMQTINVKIGNKNDAVDLNIRTLEEPAYSIEDKVSTAQSNDLAASLAREKASGLFSVKAKVFVTNIDAPGFENKLVSVSERDERSAAGVPSCGIVSLHFALNATLRSLSHHTLYLSKSYRNSWNVVDNPDTATFNPSEFNFYVHSPSRTDCTVCPEGHDAITVLVPVPPLPRDGHAGHVRYDRDTLRTAVLRKLQEMEDNYVDQDAQLVGDRIVVADHIVASRVREPEDWRREFGLHRGSAFGLAHSLDQLNLLRPRLRHPRIRNLYR